MLEHFRGNRVLLGFAVLALSACSSSGAIVQPGNQSGSALSLSVGPRVQTCRTDANVAGSHGGAAAPQELCGPPKPCILPAGFSYTLTGPASIPASGIYSWSATPNPASPPPPCEVTYLWDLGSSPLWPFFRAGTDGSDEGQNASVIIDISHKWSKNNPPPQVKDGEYTTWISFAPGTMSFTLSVTATVYDPVYEVIVGTFTATKTVAIPGGAK